VKNYSNNFFQNFDGIIGLSPEGLAAENILTYLENIKNHKIINNNVFSFYFNEFN